MHTGPAGAVTATRCSSSSPSRTRTEGSATTWNHVSRV
jgi:hypothetical protein